MSLFLKRAVEGKPIIIFGDGNQKRDFTHVSDVVQANVKAILDNKIKNEVFNVSTGIGTTIRDLAKLIQRFHEKKVRIIYDKKVKEGEVSKFFKRVRLPSELRNMILSYLKAQRLLDFKPALNLEQGIKEQLLWVEQNKTRWKKISI